jgi:hypothetical protein
LVVATSGPDRLQALDLPTGKTLWSSELSLSATTGPVIMGQRIVMGADRGVIAHSLLDGRPVDGWNVAGTAVSGELCTADGHIIYVDDRGHLMLLSEHNGLVMAEHAGATPGTAVIAGQGRVLFVGPQGLMTVALNDPAAKPEVWVDAPRLGRTGTVMVQARSRVFVGCFGQGLVCFGEHR